MARLSSAPLAASLAPLSRVVTVIVVVAVAVGLGWLLSNKVARPTVGQRYQTWALFRDGSGLPVGSQVVIAGVRVGEIDALTIEGGLARISMRLRDDVILWDDATAAKKASSLLGDNYIELLPGGPEKVTKTAGHRRLASGEAISRVIEGSSTDRTMRKIDTALPRVDRALTSAQEALRGSRLWVAGPFASGARDAEAWIDSGPIEAPLATASRGVSKFEAWTEEVAAATSRAAASSDRTLDGIAVDIDDARRRMADVRGSIEQGLGGARSRLDEVDPYIDQAAEYLAALAERRQGGTAEDERPGTLARLVHDEELGAKIHDGAEAGAEFTGTLQRFQSYIGIRTEFNLLSRKPRLYAIAEITGRANSFFRVELEKGALGDVPQIHLTDVPGSDAFVRTATIREHIRFSAQWGKRLGPMAFRFGLKDSSVGAGADLTLFNDRLTLSSDVFGADFANAPRVKLAAALQVFRSIYILAGIDDALTPGGYLPIAPWPPGQDVPIYFEELHYGRDYFGGAMLTFTEDDLTTMLRVYGAMVAGLL